MPAFCVEVKPRNSSAFSGISSAPGTPAAIAICFGSDRLAVEAAACEAAAEARHVEDVERTDALERVVDVRPQIAAEQDRDVVLLEHRLLRIARETARGEQGGLAGPAVVREVERGRGRRRSGGSTGSPHATVTPSPAGDGA